MQTLSLQNNWRKDALPIQICCYSLSTYYMEGLGWLQWIERWIRLAGPLAFLQLILNAFLELLFKVSVLQRKMLSD